MPVHDHKLASYFGLALPLVRVAVADIQTLEVETRKHSTDVWMVIDADHHPTLAAPHEVGHALVFLEREIKPITSGQSVRRIHVEERVRSIVALGAGEPGQVLDVGVGESLPRGG